MYAFLIDILYILGNRDCPLLYATYPFLHVDVHWHMYLKQTTFENIVMIVAKGEIAQNKKFLFLPKELIQ